MSTSKVLEEANSIAEKIAIFNQEDENPYHQIKQKISEKNIKHIVTVARGTSTVQHYTPLICLQKH